MNRLKFRYLQYQSRRRQRKIFRDVSKRFDKNSPVEDLLSYLRQGGIPAIPTIKLLQELYGMDLKDAKTTFENSKTWADKKPERDKFYETVAEALNIMEKESEDEND